jgi:hypothetical protein
MTTPPATASERAILGQLARVHARRYAKHPLFLIGFVLAVAATIWDIVANPNLDPDRDGGLHFYSAFLIGVLGLIVAYRLTRTEEKAIALLPSAPTSRTIRTLALCAACLVPALAAALVLAVAVIGWQVHPPSYLQTWLDAMPTAEFVAWILGGTVVAGLGGPLLGVAVGRWWRFPGAGVVAAVLLVVLATAPNVFASDVTDIFASDRADLPSVPSRIAWLVSPWIVWLNISAGTEVTADGLPIVPWVMGPGSAVGHLVYTVGLCGLAAWAAVIKGAEGNGRSRWMHSGAIALVVTLGGLAWAVFG